MPATGVNVSLKRITGCGLKPCATEHAFRFSNTPSDLYLFLNTIRLSITWQFWDGQRIDMCCFWQFTQFRKHSNIHQPQMCSLLVSRELLTEMNIRIFFWTVRYFSSSTLIYFPKFSAPIGSEMQPPLFLESNFQVLYSRLRDLRWLTLSFCPVHASNGVTSLRPFAGCLFLIHWQCW